MRKSTFSAVLALLLVGCPKEEAPEPVAEPVEVRAAPGPLPERPFKMPEVERHTLSNGLDVLVATNDETPMVQVRLVLKVGGYLDPEGRAGLASVTFDLLDDGAGDLSAEDLSRALKRLGSSLGSSANTGGASVSISTLKKNLEPTLDLWATVVTAPTFPDKEWSILQKRRIADVIASREDPVAVARAASYKVLYGDRFEGRKALEADYERIDTAAMRAWYGAHVGPVNGILIVGGDVTAAEIVPLLEARLGGWTPTVEPAKPDLSVEKPEGKLYFIDKPGAAQSVIRLGTIIGDRLDADWHAFGLANDVLGGQFTSRVNLNLRENKGYTYGARCFTVDGDGPGLWGCQTSVRTDVTKESLIEIDREIRDVLGQPTGDAAGRPVSPEELAYFQSSAVLGFPGQYETVSAVLGEQVEIWRHGLPADWLERHVPSVKAVTVEGANTAFQAHVDPTRIAWVVVGDKSQVWDGLSVLGLPIVELDRDGNPIPAE